MKGRAAERKRFAAGLRRRTAAVQALAVLLTGLLFRAAAAEGAEGERARRTERVEQAESQSGPIRIGGTRLRLWVVLNSPGGFRINLLDGGKRPVRTFWGGGSGGTAVLEAKNLSPGQYYLEASLPGGSVVIASCQPEETP